MRAIDLNCDLGEGCGHDGELIPLVSSVNVACGGHAGDDELMRAAVCLAVRCGVNIGAHPGYADRANFGRVEPLMSPADVQAMVVRQVSRLHAIATAEGATLRHVKPHGALYHAAGRDAAIAGAVVRAAAAVAPDLAIVAPAATALEAAARRLGLQVVAEGFVDRRYRRDGTLVPRSAAGATIDDHTAAADQALGLILNGTVIADDGTAVAVAAQTLCVHGDGVNAVQTLTALRRHLAERAIVVRPFGP